MNIQEFLSTELVLSLIITLVFIALVFIYINLLQSISKIPHVQASKEFGGHISKLEQEISTLKESNVLLTEKISELIPLTKQIKKTGIIRYNPFKDSGVGGKQSFSTAIIDALGNGLIISNLFSREMTRVSAKEIKEWQPIEQQLSPEEKEVLESLQ